MWFHSFTLVDAIHIAPSAANGPISCFDILRFVRITTFSRSRTLFKYLEVSAWQRDREKEKTRERGREEGEEGRSVRREEGVGWTEIGKNEID